MSFSQRAGLTPAVPPLQREVVESGTRTRLWNILHVAYWSRAGGEYVVYSPLQPLFDYYWHHLFQWRLDQRPSEVRQVVAIIKQTYDEFSWFQLLDFIEATGEHGPEGTATDFRAGVNAVLQADNSAYRFVGTQIAEITAPVEVESIEAALRATSTLSGVNRHLQVALERLTDRTAPDFRNSIKESVSAVEAVAQLLAGDRRATLGAALAVLEKRGQLHGALKSSLSSLYGYTSDADGIRHAMLEESTLTFTDAKFMLVACTAFINYLLSKAAELGLSLNQSAGQR